MRFIILKFKLLEGEKTVFVGRGICEYGIAHIVAYAAMLRNGGFLIKQLLRPFPEQAAAGRLGRLGGGDKFAVITLDKRSALSHRFIHIVEADVGVDAAVGDDLARRFDQNSVFELRGAGDRSVVESYLAAVLINAAALHCRFAERFYQILAGNLAVAGVFAEGIQQRQGVADIVDRLRIARFGGRGLCDGG